MVEVENPDVKAYLLKADEAFREMEILKSNGLFAGAVIRGYYAIFFTLLVPCSAQSVWPIPSIAL